MRLDQNQVSLWEKGKFVISNQEKRGKLFLFDCRIHDKGNKKKNETKAVEKSDPNHGSVRGMVKYMQAKKWCRDSGGERSFGVEVKEK